ncbi:MAG: hypothetical protein EBT02_10830 [Planctomycetia bacterium]|nr:hypothetical protein [Planctomycetia bacterium]
MPRAFVNFAYAEFHSSSALLHLNLPYNTGWAFLLLLVFVDSPLSRRMTEKGTQSMGLFNTHTSIMANHLLALHSVLIRGYESSLPAFQHQRIYIGRSIRKPVLKDSSGLTCIILPISAQPIEANQ